MKFSVIHKLFILFVVFIERQISFLFFIFFSVKQTLILALIFLILVTVMMPGVNTIKIVVYKKQTTSGGNPTPGRKVRQVYVQGNFKSRDKYYAYKK